MPAWHPRSRPSSDKLCSLGDRPQTIHSGGWQKPTYPEPHAHDYLITSPSLPLSLHKYKPDLVIVALAVLSGCPRHRGQLSPSRLSMGPRPAENPLVPEKRASEGVHESSPDLGPRGAYAQSNRLIRSFVFCVCLVGLRQRIQIISKSSS
jgi:hypothetical protein